MAVSQHTLSASTRLLQGNQLKGEQSKQWGHQEVERDTRERLGAGLGSRPWFKGSAPEHWLCDLEQALYPHL